MSSMGDLKFEEIELQKKENEKPLYYKFSDYEYNTNSKERVLSGIEQLDYMIKGFELGCITIWTGQTNAGKSTVMTTITKQTILQGEKVFFFNGEQTKDDFKNNLYKQTVKKEDIYAKQYKDTIVNDYYVKDSQIAKLNALYGNNIFVYNNDGKRDINTILTAMEEVRVKEGVRVFILDNFMQIDTLSSDEYREQKDIMEKLRTFAVNKNVHIHLVAHPRKTDKSALRLTIYDVLGSSNLVNKAYNVISIIRVDNLDTSSNEYEKLTKDMYKARYDITGTSTILEILKTKGVCCGLVGLVYDKVTKSFTEQMQMTDYESKKVQQMSIQPKDECPF